MVTNVRARQLPGLAILGLLASLLAHTASYGGNHELGGAFHTTLELLALVGAGAFAASIGALAWVGARRQAQGSILAAALRPLVPSAGSLMVSAGLWFVLIESLEPEHLWHASLLVVTLCLVAASLLVAFTARTLLRAVAAIVLAIARLPFVRRPVCYRRRFTHRSSARRAVFVYRRFARPPPGPMLLPV